MQVMRGIWNKLYHITKLKIYYGYNIVGLEITYRVGNKKRKLKLHPSKKYTGFGNAGVLEQGPWGGNGGETWDMGQADHISNVKIHYIDAVFAFDFTFTVGGVTKTINVGGDAPQYNEITLEDDEYFTFISGYFKAM
ncbi:unnamed protein product [Musa textilis]